MKSDIVIVGCGGTGSHYIKELGRYLYGNRCLRNDEIRMYSLRLVNRSR